MYTGRPEELRRKEQQAAALAAQVGLLLTQIEALNIGPVLPAAGRIAGPGFDLRRTATGWTTHRPARP
ncbi:hypothetical protein ACIGHB_29935 [Streptomyces sp. NPDC085460]|uniref:hypothetical protein n=1 Tax=Streptomyces sp. NPDC085460 TaxID=3365723 RepID=UPI0037D94A89